MIDDEHKNQIKNLRMSAPSSFDEATAIAADPNILKVGNSDKLKM